MKFSVKRLAESVDGQILGRDDLTIERLVALDEAVSNGLSPLFRKRYLRDCSRLPGAVLTDEALAPLALARGIGSAIIHPNPSTALANLIDLFYPEPPLQQGFVHPSAIIDPDASIDPTSWIGPGVVIEQGVVIRCGVWIGPNAVIMRETQVGKYVRIGPGAVIGAEGFGFVPGENGPVKLRQVGRVVIEDFVEIGANSCIDRATLGTTVVGANTKLDNLVQIGHNCKIGRNALLAGQTGVAGSSIIGDGAMLGGQVGIADHLKVGKNARIAAQSGVTRSIVDNEIVAGYPAMEHSKWLRGMAHLMHLGEKKPRTHKNGEEK